MHVNVLAAILSNAVMLGLTVAATTDEATESPFYLDDRSDDALNAHRRVFAHVKPSLQPTPSQLSCRHHPYLDLLPFPTFRERTIRLLAADPPLIDEEDLCRDLVDEAFVCWGSSLGPGLGVSGAPWDIRSWEVKPWFVKKWWMLTGGLEGEMFEQMRWWREMRGEHAGFPCG